jgi:hypothetical protein
MNDKRRAPSICGSRKQGQHNPASFQVCGKFAALLGNRARSPLDGTPRNGPCPARASRSWKTDDLQTTGPTGKNDPVDLATIASLALAGAALFIALSRRRPGPDAPDAVRRDLARLVEELQAASRDQVARLDREVKRLQAAVAEAERARLALEKARVPTPPPQAPAAPAPPTRPRRPRTARPTPFTGASSNSATRASRRPTSASKPGSKSAKSSSSSASARCRPGRSRIPASPKPVLIPGPADGCQFTPGPVH